MASKRGAEDYLTKDGPTGGSMETSEPARATAAQLATRRIKQAKALRRPGARPGSSHSQTSFPKSPFNNSSQPAQQPFSSQSGIFGAGFDAQPQAGFFGATANSFPPTNGNSINGSSTPSSSFPNFGSGNGGGATDFSFSAPKVAFNPFSNSLMNSTNGTAGPVNFGFGQPATAPLQNNIFDFGANKTQDSPLSIPSTLGQQGSPSPFQFGARPVEPAPSTATPAFGGMFTAPAVQPTYGEHLVDDDMTMSSDQSPNKPETPPAKGQDSFGKLLKLPSTRGTLPGEQVSTVSAEDAADRPHIEEGEVAGEANTPRLNPFASLPRAPMQTPKPREVRQPVGQTNAAQPNPFGSLMKSGASISTTASSTLFKPPPSKPPVTQPAPTFTAPASTAASSSAALPSTTSIFTPKSVPQVGVHSDSQTSDSFFSATTKKAAPIEFTPKSSYFPSPVTAQKIAAEEEITPKPANFSSRAADQTPAAAFDSTPRPTNIFTQSANQTPAPTMPDSAQKSDSSVPTPRHAGLLHNRNFTNLQSIWLTSEIRLSMFREDNLPPPPPELELSEEEIQYYYQKIKLARLNISTRDFFVAHGSEKSSFQKLNLLPIMANYITLYEELMGQPIQGPLTNMVLAYGDMEGQKLYDQERGRIPVDGTGKRKHGGDFTSRDTAIAKKPKIGSVSKPAPSTAPRFSNLSNVAPTTASQPTSSLSTSSTAMPAPAPQSAPQPVTPFAQSSSTANKFRDLLSSPDKPTTAQPPINGFRPATSGSQFSAPGATTLTPFAKNVGTSTASASTAPALTPFANMTNTPPASTHSKDTGFGFSKSSLGGQGGSPAVSTQDKGANSTFKVPSFGGQIGSPAGSTQNDGANSAFKVPSFGGQIGSLAGSTQNDGANTASKIPSFGGSTSTSFAPTQSIDGSPAFKPPSSAPINVASDSAQPKNGNSVFHTPLFGVVAPADSQSNGASASFKVPSFGAAAPANFMAQFGKNTADVIAKLESDAKRKRKAEEFDSEEDDEAEWERQDAEKQAAKKEKMKNEVKQFQVPKFGAAVNNSSPKAQSPLFVPNNEVVHKPSSSLLMLKNGPAPAVQSSIAPPFTNGGLFSSRSASPAASTVGGASVFDAPQSGRSNLAPVNPFAHLSDRGSDSGKGDADDEDTNSEGDAKQVSKSGETPSDLSTKKIGPFSESDEASSVGGSTAGKGLFERITRDAPKPDSAVSAMAKANQTTMFSFAQTSPADHTWKPDSPIKFGASNKTDDPVASTSGSATSSLFNFPSSASLKPVSGTESTASAIKPFQFTSLGATTPVALTAPKAVSSNPFGGLALKGQTSSLFPVSKAGTLLGSSITSAATSRASTPGISDMSGAESTANEQDDTAPDPQNDLVGMQRDQIGHDVLFDTAKASARKHSKNEMGKMEWTVMGTGPVAILKNQTTGVLSILMKKAPAGGVVINTRLMPSFRYEQVGKRAKFMTVRAEGGLDSWLVSFTTEDESKNFVRECEENKSLNDGK